MSFFTVGTTKARHYNSDGSGNMHATELEQKQLSQNYPSLKMNTQRSNWDYFLFYCENLRLTHA
jgi:hypothetical protein